MKSDVESRNRVVQENLGLVFRVARQYANRGLTFEDLVAEGNLGLIRAAEHYDPGYGTRFSTYAVFFIKDSIQSALANTATTIRVPMSVSRLLGRWRRTERKLWHVRGRRPTFEDVANAMGLDQSTRRLIDRAQRVACIRRPHEGSRAGHGLEWCIRDGETLPEESLAAREEQQSVSRRLERLGPTERAVIVLRYGLGGEPPMSLEQIRDRLGITRAAVVKLASSAIRELGRHGKACG
jgi:RNA polymerase primary sigma factor